MKTTEQLQNEYFEAISERRARRDISLEAQARYAAAEQEVTKLRRELALSVECPFCHVPAGTKCFWGDGVSMYPTHGVRDDAAGANMKAFSR